MEWGRGRFRMGVDAPGWSWHGLPKQGSLPLRAPGEAQPGLQVPRASWGMGLPGRQVFGGV